MYVHTYKFMLTLVIRIVLYNNLLFLLCFDFIELPNMQYRETPVGKQELIVKGSQPSTQSTGDQGDRAADRVKMSIGAFIASEKVLSNTLAQKMQELKDPKLSSEQQSKMQDEIRELEVKLKQLAGHKPVKMFYEGLLAYYNEEEEARTDKKKKKKMEMLDETNAVKLKVFSAEQVMGPDFKTSNFGASAMPTYEFIGDSCSPTGSQKGNGGNGTVTDWKLGGKKLNADKNKLEENKAKDKASNDKPASSGNRKEGNTSPEGKGGYTNGKATQDKSDVRPKSEAKQPESSTKMPQSSPEKMPQSSPEMKTMPEVKAGGKGEKGPVSYSVNHVPVLKLETGETMFNVSTVKYG